MTLATHIVAGAAGAKIMAGNPLEGFIIGFFSHFLLDSIIHWDYKLSSTRSEAFHSTSRENLSIMNKALIFDVLKVSFDAFLGFLFVFLFLGNFSGTDAFILLAGGIGGAMPDFFQFVFLLWKTKPIIWIQRIHEGVHSKGNLNKTPILGIGMQVAIIALILILVNR